MHVFVIILSWLIALAWTLRVFTALRQLPRLPNLLDGRHDPPSQTSFEDRPQVTVIVPACNEAQAIEATLRSLLAQTIPLEILAVDDRSTDRTGAIMDRIASEPLPPGKFVGVLHVEALPAGWLGKPHAMARAARGAATPWLLFTDGDMLFREDALERALHYAQVATADHVVVWPSLILKTKGERMVAGIFQSLLVLTWNPWRIADPKALRDSVGMGAFNLIRSEAYRAVGGFESDPMEVVEDLRLGFRVKQQGFRQRLAFGRGLIRVHWARGAFGMLHNLTKNIFATFRFSSLNMLLAVFAVALLCFAPLAGLFLAWPIRAASILSLVMVCAAFWIAGHYYNPKRDRIASDSDIPFIYCLTFPIGAALVLYAMLRSWIVTVVRGGIVWRGTFYPLSELRRHAGPLR